MKCSTCRYFDLPKPEETHGWCQYAHLGANVRDWTNKPMTPDGSCQKHSPPAAWHDKAIAAALASKGGAK
jgi:hypothetical protein